MSPILMIAIAVIVLAGCSFVMKGKQTAKNEQKSEKSKSESDE